MKEEEKNIHQHQNKYLRGVSLLLDDVVPFLPAIIFKSIAGGILGLI
jgi:hypothetical protein